MCPAKSNIQLYSFDQVPNFQQNNIYLTHGYRAFLSAKLCCVSVTVWSNELINIWSHALMFFVFLGYLVYDQVWFLTSMPASTEDRFAFLSFALCTQICMACSAFYHTFNCHLQEQVVMRCFSVDIIGITVSMLGCYCIGLYYGFYCIEELQKRYLTGIFIVIALSVCLIFHPDYLSVKWDNKRICHLSTIAVLALLPTIHWILVIPRVEINLFLPHVLQFYAMLFIAMLIYLTKVPECYFPGKFNYIGHSHNWWHIIIGLAFWYWRYLALDMLQYRLYNKCPK